MKAGSESIQEPKIRHISVVNGQRVKDSSFVFEIMRIIRSCVWKVDIEEV